MKYIRKIVSQCHAIDTSASNVYRAFAQKTLHPDLKDFWVALAEEEREHITYWQQLLGLEHLETYTKVFRNPAETLAHLSRLKHRARDIETDIDASATDQQMFLAALELEFIMMHPALETLFRLIKEGTEEGSPDANYDNHIQSFIDTARQHIQPTPETTLILEMLLMNWRNSQELARQLEHIKTLEGLLPICSFCKSIRDGHGQWQILEEYLSDHSKVEFTHSVCPVCIKIYYPDVPGAEGD